MYYLTFRRSVNNACVKRRYQKREKLNQFPIKPFYHHSLSYSLRRCSHLPFLISKTFSHILPMYRFNQLVTAKTISERLLLSFNFKICIYQPILTNKFQFLLISFKWLQVELPCIINITFHRIGISIPLDNVYQKINEKHKCFTLCYYERQCV